MARGMFLVHFPVRRAAVRVAVRALSWEMTGLAWFLLCLTCPYS